MKPLSEEELAEGWIAHDGEGCPVSGSVMIQTMLYGGYTGAMGKAKPAEWWTWSRNTCYPIVAYRVVDQGEALKAAVDEGVDKLGGQDTTDYLLSNKVNAKRLMDAVERENEKEALYADPSRYEQDKAMGDDKPAKDLRQLGRFSHHDTAFTTHVFYDEHPIAMITDDVISWSYHMPDMKKAASEAMHVYLGRVWK